MEGFFCKKTIRDIVPRYYATYIVIVCAILLFNTMTFFSVKMTSGGNFVVNFANDTIVEFALCLLGPIWFVFTMFKGNLTRNYADVMMAFPVRKRERVRTIMFFLIVVFLVMAALGIVVDLVLAKFASEGFVVTGFLVKKYSILGGIYLLSLGIGLIAFAGASTALEYAKNVLIYYFGIVTVVAQGLFLKNVQFGPRYQSGYKEVTRVHTAGDFYAEVSGCFCDSISKLKGGKNIERMLSIIIPIALIMLVIGYLLICRRPSERAEGMCRSEWSHILNQGLTVYLVCAPTIWAAIGILGANNMNMRLSVFNEVNPVYVFLISINLVFVVQLIMEALQRQNWRLCYKAWKGIVLGIVLVIVFSIIFGKNAIYSDSFGWVKEFESFDPLQNLF